MIIFQKHLEFVKDIAGEKKMILQRFKIIQIQGKNNREKL